MKKIISTSLAAVFLCAFFLSNVTAATPSPSPFPSSYELFYPVVAGKTPADKFYFAKTIREWIVDKLLFDQIKNADYHLTLSKKRLVEAEKLFSQKNYQLAEKTITKSVKEINTSLDTAKKAESQGEKTVDIFSTIKAVGNHEADFIEISLAKAVPESENSFLLDSAKAIRELIQ
jgi:hypothetical protein